MEESTQSQRLALDIRTIELGELGIGVVTVAEQNVDVGNEQIERCPYRIGRTLEACLVLLECG